MVKVNSRLILDGVMGYLGVGFHVHLREHARAVSADGLDAQRKFLGNLADRLAGRNHA